MRMIARAFVVIAVLSLELYAVYAVLHPRVSSEYRAHYIDRITQDWHAPRYTATPEEGFSFGKAGWPSFVRRTQGFSFQEPGGRWTDAAVLPTARIDMNREFSGPLCIRFAARPAYSQWRKSLEVALGSNVAHIPLSSFEPAIYQVSFANAQAADTLEFRLQGPVPSNIEYTHSGDDRHLGVLLIWLKILPSECTGI